jgi:hypothetical protein
MQVTLLNGYPDYVGKRFIWAGYGNGPSSYATGGDEIELPGFQSYIDTVDTSGILTVSGTYTVRAIPSAAGPRATWKLKWYTAAAPQTEVTAAVDLSAEILFVSGKGGRY